MFGWFKQSPPRQSSIAADEVRTMAMSMARNMMARYDAAQTTDENTRHWANADGLSAAAANNPSVRKKLRDRSRYEFANNCFANGMIRTVANHCIGTGPRLQVDTGDEAIDQKIERAWERWSRETGLADKLRTMRQAKCRDGEAFAMFITNNALRGPVKLDLRLIECDQIASPYMTAPSATHIDGIDFDAVGNRTRYHLLKDHPGGAYYGSDKADPIPADMIVHLFRADRPGQVRGVPEITPALPLYAVLRRYTLATLHAAEVAAIFAIVLKSTGSVDADSVEAFETLALERNAMTTLPAGWDISQVKPEHPQQAYDAFQKSIIREIARCLSMPFGIAAGDSSSYNYSSFKADDQLWVNELGIERDYTAIECLDRIADQWRKEATLARVIPEVGDDILHRWFWDERPSVDAYKDAQTAVVLRNAGLLTEADYHASNGDNWRQQHAQRKREHDSRRELELPVNEPLPEQPQDAAAAQDEQMQEAA